MVAVWSRGDHWHMSKERGAHGQVGQILVPLGSMRSTHIRSLLAPTRLGPRPHAYLDQPFSSDLPQPASSSFADGLESIPVLLRDKSWLGGFLPGEPRRSISISCRGRSRSRTSKRAQRLGVHKQAVAELGIDNHVLPSFSLANRETVRVRA